MTSPNIADSGMIKLISLNEACFGLANKSFVVTHHIETATHYTHGQQNDNGYILWLIKLNNKDD